MVRAILVDIAVGAFVLLGILDLGTRHWRIGVAALLLATANYLLLR